MKLRIVLLATVMAALLLSSCAPLNFYKKVDGFIAAGQYAEAGGIIEKEKKQYAGEHELLYYFDKGAVLQMTGDYRGSTAALERAELKIDELYTKSVSKELFSFLSNDLNLPYEGEDFEQVMVNALKELNFMYAGKFDPARVESRKIDHRLNLLTDRYEGKNIYRQDAFARYLSAMVYESLGERDNAYIDYKKSLKAYQQYEKLYGIPVPVNIKSDILRTADWAREKEDIAEYKKQWGDVPYERYAAWKEKGEAVIIVYDGMAPYKATYYVNAPVKDGKGKVSEVIRVAFPKFVPRGFAVASVSAEAKGEIAQGFMAEDFNMIGVRNLENKIGLISVKAIARAIAKHQAKRAVDNSGKNKGLGMLMSIYNMVSEQADTRCWRTLPARFHILRIALAPGKYELKVNLHLPAGGTDTRTIRVKIKKGKKKVVPVFAFNG